LHASPNIIWVIKTEGEMGGPCSTHGNETYIQYFGWKICREETTRKT